MPITAEILDSPAEFHGGHEGANYLRNNLGLDLGPFSMLVADILGFVWKGIYHLGDARLQKSHWKETMVELVIPGALSTSDVRDSRLTSLVVLCHDAAILLEVSPCSQHMLRLQFWPRQRTGRLSQRHPTIEQAVAGIRRALTGDGAED